MRLRHERTGCIVERGTHLKDFRGNNHVVCGWQVPHKEGSTGRIFTQFLGEEDAGDMAYFPSVFGCVWELIDG